MTTAEKGCKVKVHYTGTLEDGTVFDSSLEREPLEFTVGAGQMIAGFDEGVVGMKVEDEKSIVLPPEKAYGMPSDEMLIPVPVEHLPEGYKPTVGDSLAMQSPDGRPFPVTVKEIKEEEGKVILDGNHMLAGKTLNFQIKMVEITPAE